MARLEDGKVVEVVPAKCAFRGFTRLGEEEGFRRLTLHMAESAERLVKDVDS